jgi:hypothetical protein
VPISFEERKLKMVRLHQFLDSRAVFSTSVSWFKVVISVIIIFSEQLGHSKIE